MKTDKMLEQLKQFVAKHQLLCNGGITLLTVSSGVDSVVMAHFFYQAGWPFAIAHCNFGLRGGESDLDEVFVKALAQKFQVPFFSKCFDTNTYVTQHKVSIQMAARTLRYAWFAELLVQQGFLAIATAHHQTDSAETMLINLVRGTGIAGLHGIQPKKDNVIRPLLCFTKQDILEYATANNLQYREDSSNSINKYLRNNIRHNVLPALKLINPDFESTMQANAERIKGWEALALAQLGELKAKFVVEKEGQIIFALNELKNQPYASATLCYWLTVYGFNEDQIDEMLLDSETTSGRIFYTTTHRAICNRGQLIITENKVSINDSIEVSLQVGHLLVGNHQLFIKKETKPETFVRDTAINRAYFDATKLKEPLQLRKWKHGDVFCPLGLLGKRKKVSDFFIDNKLSVVDKEEAWILTSGNEIAWIVAQRIDERFKITEDTREMLIFEWQ